MPTTLPICLFLDLDGTLLELAGEPGAVVVPRRLPALLAGMERLLQGASAIVSGRNVEIIDQILHPYRGNAVGVHGLERRLAGAAIERTASDGLPRPLAAAVRRIASRFGGSIIEDKGGALAVHERGNETDARLLFGLVEREVAAFSPEWQCLSGHRLIEVKPAGVSKGSAVNWLLRQMTFANRVPVAIGDDITDLDMFTAIEARGGLTISVGERIAGAGHLRLQSPEEVTAFLEEWMASGCDDSVDLVREIARAGAGARET